MRNKQDCVKYPETHDESDLSLIVQCVLGCVAMLLTLFSKPEAWSRTLAGVSVAWLANSWWQRRARSARNSVETVLMLKVFYQAEFEKFLVVVVLLSIIFQMRSTANQGFVLLGFGLPQLAMVLIVGYRVVFAPGGFRK